MAAHLLAIMYGILSVGSEDIIYPPIRRHSQLDRRIPFFSNVNPQKVSSKSFLYSNTLSHELHKLNTVFQDERHCIFSGPWRVWKVYGSYVKGVDFMDGVGEDGYKGLFRYSQVLLKEIG